MPDDPSTPPDPAPGRGKGALGATGGPTLAGEELGTFLRELLEAQRQAAPAEAGVYLLTRQGAAPDVLALSPAARPGQSAPAWVAQAGELVNGMPEPPERMRLIALESGGGFYGQNDTTLVLAWTGVTLEERGRAGKIVAVFVVRADAVALPAIARRIELSTRLADLHALRSLAARREADVHALRVVLETVASAGEPHRFGATAIALVNHIAAAWRCDRVSLGMVRSASARVRAISHTDRLVRGSGLVERLEGAMEESLDQDLEVWLPAGPNERRIARAAKELAETDGSGVVCTLPLRHAGSLVGALTLERPAERPFETSEIEALRLVCDLVAGRLATLHRHDRWLGARLADETRESLGKLIGPEHTWAKALVAGLLALVIVATFVKGTLRVEGSFRLEASERRVVPAPFDGYVREAAGEVGDAVAPDGEPLARLDDAELRLQLSAERAELASHLREVSVAQRERDEAKAQMGRAKADMAHARIALLEHKLARADVRAPIAGRVIVGEGRRLVGSPVRTGEPLFEVAPLEALRAEVFVPEDQIADLAVGQRGALATASRPDARIGLVVERIEPAAEVRNGRNVFRVRARLDETPAWLRPGMEGAARIDAGRRTLGWLWTRRVVNWARMALWL